MTTGPSTEGAPCPPWCRREHAASPHPDDQVHQTRAGFVAARIRRRSGAYETAEVIAIGRATDVNDPWVEISETEDAQRCIALSADTAGHLARALEAVLRELDQPVNDRC